MMIVKSVEY